MLRNIFLRWYARRWPDRFERLCEERGIDADFIRWRIGA